MPDYTVTTSTDGLQAFLQVTVAPGDDYPAWEVLHRETLNRGVIFGISEKALRAMAEQRVCGRKVEIAHGLPAGRSYAARLEKLVDTSGRGKPREMQDGKVDHRDLQYLINVDKGTGLVRRHPPQTGEDGMNVAGQPIKAEEPKDVSLPIRKGTEVSPSDPDLLVAAIDGALMVFADGTLGVRNEKTIECDIDYSTGSIRFAGDLRIRGAVRAGFEVETRGDLKVDGQVEDSVITCGGDLDIAGGAVGGARGTIRCAGSVRVRRVERFTVVADADLTVTEDAILSTIEAKGTVRARSIVGGSAVSCASIEADEVGTDAETKTAVRIKGVQDLEERKYGLLKELAKETNALGEAKEAMFVLVRDGMNPAGLLDEEKTGRLAFLRRARGESARRRRGLEEQIAGIDREIAGLPRGYLRARAVFPGVVMRFGTFEKMIVDRMNNVQVSMDGGRLCVEPWQPA